MSLVLSTSKDPKDRSGELESWEAGPSFCFPMSIIQDPYTSDADRFFNIVSERLDVVGLSFEDDEGTIFDSLKDIRKMLKAFYKLSNEDVDPDVYYGYMTELEQDKADDRYDGLLEDLKELEPNPTAVFKLKIKFVLSDKTEIYTRFIDVFADMDS